LCIFDKAFLTKTMGLHLSYTLEKALAEIGATKKQHFLIHEEEEPRLLENTDIILEKYAQAKRELIEMVNILGKKKGFSTDLQNWILENEEDEIAYFLNEAGANCLAHAEWKAPKEFHLWTGKKGFILGVEQSGKSFSAKNCFQESRKKILQSSGGKGFAFFKDCRSAIFFDNPKEARTIFFQIIF